MMYRQGTGVSQDNALAVHWYLKAAEQGHAEAQYNLAVMYETGSGVPMDLVQACKWMNLSMAAGNENAQRSIGTIEDRMPPTEIERALIMAGDWLKKHK
jgi:TPR repeat protein